MIRKVLLLTAMFVCSLVASQAQIKTQMSDKDVADYITVEMKKGTSQQKIGQSLIEKGVTTEQLNRVRKQYLSKNAAANNANKKDIDTYQDNFRSTQKEYDTNSDMGLIRESATDSLLMIYNDRSDSKAVFGRDIFNNKNLTFEPNMNMATPANYTLGPGDQVIIDVWGASQKTYTNSISPDGTIVIDEVGPIHLAGLSVQSAKATIKNRLGQFYSGCNFNLSVGNIRTIQVQVVGEVKVPGTYSLSGFSSAFNALYAAGGINDKGTLRNIKVYRANKVLAVVDVYDYLVNGNSSSDVRLQDKDIIVVGTYECLVNAKGRVKRPMYYEMRKTESVKQLLHFVGGFANDAYTQSIKLVRKTGVEYSIHTIGEFDMGGFTVMDGDEISVDSIIARYSNLVEVRGAVKHAGQFQLGNKIQSVRELIEAADGLREDAYIERAIMHRQKDDLSLEMVSVDIKGIMAGTSADIPLKKNDLLFVPSKTEMRGNWTVNIRGEVTYPAVYPFAENTSIQDIILQAGGLTDAASLAKVDVYRRIVDPKATSSDETMAVHYKFSLDENFNILSDTTFYLKPYDEVYIRKSPGYEMTQNVRVSGCVNFSGSYVFTKRDYRLSDLIKDAGGLTSTAYAKGTRLMRRLTPEEKIQRDNAIKRAQITLYENSLIDEDKRMDFAKADTLISMKMNLDDSYPVAVDLEEAMRNPGSSFDITLRRGDILTVPQFSNTVKISGEVSCPISMNYKQGEKLKYYINHAGGFANQAKKNAIYIIYANGSVEKAEKGSKIAVQPGCEIVVPTKDESRKLTTPEIISLGTGTASLSAIILSILNIVK